MRSRPVRWIFVFVTTALLASLGYLKGQAFPSDPAEMVFFLEDSPLAGRADKAEIDRVLWKIFSDKELVAHFSRVFAEEARKTPNGVAWVHTLLRRAEIENEPPADDFPDEAFRHYLRTQATHQLARRISGSPARSRVDFQLYGPAHQEMRLYLGFRGKDALPWLTEATAKAFNETIDHLNEARGETWEEQAGNLEGLLVSRFAFFSARIEAYGGEVSAARTRLIERMEGMENKTETLGELEAWLRSEQEIDSSAYLRWSSRFEDRNSTHEEIQGELESMRSARRMQELLLETDWLDPQAFAPRTFEEKRMARHLFFAPKIPEEQMSYSPERVVEPSGVFAPPSWSSTLGGALAGLAMALAFLALEAGILDWKNSKGHP